MVVVVVGIVVIVVVVVVAAGVVVVVVVVVIVVVGIVVVVVVVVVLTKTNIPARLQVSRSTVRTIALEHVQHRDPKFKGLGLRVLKGSKISSRKV